MAAIRGGTYDLFGVSRSTSGTRRGLDGREGAADRRTATSSSMYILNVS